MTADFEDDLRRNWTSFWPGAAIALACGTAAAGRKLILEDFAPEPLLAIAGNAIECI